MPPSNHIFWKEPRNLPQPSQPTKPSFPFQVGFCDPSTKKPGMEWGSLETKRLGRQRKRRITRITDSCFMSLMSSRGVGRGFSVRVWGFYDSYALWFSLNELETCRKARICKGVMMFLDVFGDCKPKSIHF